MNLFKNTNNNKRYYTLDYYYKNLFNQKVSKLSLDAPFTCPNIDGTKGYNGCIYCTPFNNNESIEDQIIKQKNIIDHKWPNSKYIAYLQSHSNTYGSIEKLKSIYEPLLKINNVIGLSIGTRVDCIDDDCLNYLENLSKRTFLTVELGLQTIHEKTSKLINRCHSLDEFDDMVKKLKSRNINVVVHIIDGLPFETKEMMIETVKHLNTLNIDGIKIHMLFIDKNAPIKNLKFKTLSKEEYIDIVCDQIEELNPNIVIHRLTGDGNRSTLIEPLWSLKKVSVLNDIDKCLAKRNTYQGFNRCIDNKINQLIIDNIKPNDIVIDTTNNLFLKSFNNNIHTSYDNSFNNKVSLIISNDYSNDYLNLLNNKGIIIIKNNIKLNNIKYHIYTNSINEELIYIYKKENLN